MDLKEIPFYYRFKHLNIVMFCVFGSNLYGTNTENSDKDYKGIYIPTDREMFLGQVRHSIHFKTKKSNIEGDKNSKEDVDIEFLSLQYFMELACQGETMCIDMLHAPEDKLIVTSDTWKRISGFKESFYTKSLDSFIGYARKQAAKYGIKGSRLDDMKKVLDFCDKIFTEYESEKMIKQNPRKDKISFYWNYLPEGEHIHKLDPQTDDKNRYRMYQVCGQNFQETVSLSYMKKSILIKYNEYGERARKAQASEGVDWKAISHAMRAAYQLISIYKNNTIIYPLPEAEYLRDIKEGKLGYPEVGPILEGLMEEVELLSQKSTLPEKIDVDFFMSYIYNEIKLNCCKNNSIS